MAGAVPSAKTSAEEYLAWERGQDQRHEFADGEVFAMAGGSPRHNALCAAVIRDLGIELRGGDCRVLTSDQRVSLAFQSRYVYPDATVICGPAELEAGTRDVITNPQVVVEVLSTNTEVNDRGSKWEGYRRLGSLRDYLLVSQHSRSVEHFQRQDDGSWRYTVAGAGQRITLTSGVGLDLDQLYDGVFELPSDEPASPAQAADQDLE